MEFTIFLVLLFPASFVYSAVPNNIYTYVSQKKNWDDALDNCIINYKDLIQVEGGVNTTTVLDMFDRTGKAWIGLFKNLSDWTWVNGEPLTYSRWKDGQPDNHYGDEYCVFIDADGEWQDESCSENKTYAHFNDDLYNVSVNKMTWDSSNAQCQSLELELVVIANETINNQVKALLNEDAWIGLSKSDRWFWSESKQVVTNPDWKTGQPNNTESDLCAAIEMGDGTWWDETCDTILPSLCYRESDTVAGSSEGSSEGSGKSGSESDSNSTQVNTKNTIVGVKIQSSADMEIEAVASDFLQQLQTSVVEQGLSSVKLTWNKSPVKKYKKVYEEEEEEGVS